MIHLKLIRTKPKDTSQNFTCGEMFIRDSEDKNWLNFCYTLEDKVRDVNMNGKFDNGEKKVYGETAIPFGKYDGKITMSNLFKKEMPLIMNVSEFKGIRIHGGNDVSDTLGCILVAHNTDNKGKIWKTAEYDLMAILKADNKEGLFTIEII